MTPALHMSRIQEKRSYREAVRESLETFYGKSKPEATILVRAWWTRLSATRAFESGIFLHSEPVNTAANIAGVPVVAITGQNRTKYHRILDRSRDLVLSGAMPLQSAAQAKKLQVERQKQLLHFANSSASSSVRGKTSQTLVKKAKESKSAQKRQVAFS